MKTFDLCWAVLRGSHSHDGRATYLLGRESREEKPTKATVYPTALFRLRGSVAAAPGSWGSKVTDLLFREKLATRESIYLVDREDLKKTLGEAELKPVRRRQSLPRPPALAS